MSHYHEGGEAARDDVPDRRRTWGVHQVQRADQCEDMEIFWQGGDAGVIRANRRGAANSKRQSAPAALQQVSSFKQWADLCLESEADTECNDEATSESDSKSSDRHASSGPTTPSQQSEDNSSGDQPMTYAAAVLANAPCSTPCQQKPHNDVGTLCRNASMPRDTSSRQPAAAQHLACNTKASPKLVKVAGSKMPKTKPGPAEAERRRLQALQAKAQRSSLKADTECNAEATSESDCKSSDRLASSGLASPSQQGERHSVKQWCPQCMGDLQLGLFAPIGQSPNRCHTCKMQREASEIIVKQSP